MICLQADQQRLQGLQTYDMFVSTWLAKISYAASHMKIIPFLLLRIGPLHRAQIGIHMIQLGWSLGGFVQSAAKIAIKK